MLAARIAETCFFIGRSPFLPFGLCGASSFCVPRDASILENFFHFVQRWNSQEKLSFLCTLHKSHPHSCKIYAFLSAFLAFHGKTTSFLIYYKMKTTFIFENFLSRALWCCKVKRRSPVTFTGKRLCFGIRMLLLLKKYKMSKWNISFTQPVSIFCTFAQKQAAFSGKKPLASVGISLYNGRSEITFHF